MMKFGIVTEPSKFEFMGDSINQGYLGVTLHYDSRKHATFKTAGLSHALKMEVLQVKHTNNHRKTKLILLLLFHFAKLISKKPQNSSYYTIFYTKFKEKIFIKKEQKR